MYEMRSNAGGEVDLAELRQARQRDSAPDIRQYRGVYMTRLILRILSLLTCGSIIFILLRSLKDYRDTKDVTNNFREGTGSYPVWPDNLTLYPTFILLGAAAFAGILSLILILASFFKAVRRMTTTGNVPAVIISTACLAVWVGVTGYYGSWDSKKTNWDLMSWSCTHTDPQYKYKDMDFGHICMQMRGAFWAGAGLGVLELLNLLIFVVWWLRTRRARGYQKMQDGKAGKHPNFIPNLS